MRLSLRIVAIALTVLLVAVSPTVSSQTDRPACYWNGDSSGSSSGGLFTTTGAAWMDAGFNRELYYLRPMFGVNPAFFLYDDSGGANAQATPNVMSPMFRDGTVVFGKELMTTELQKTGPSTNFTIPAIMAHEFTHILQFKTGEHLPTMLAELEADYMAGWYMERRDRQSGWSSYSVMQGLQDFYDHGDYDFNEPDHHGTPEQRMASFRRGFQTGSQPLMSAFRMAGQYVRAIPTTGNSGSDGGALSGHNKGGLSTSQAGLKDALQTILRASSNGFRSLKGQRDPDGNSWSATVVLEGAHGCEVFGPDPFYSCTMTITSDEDEAATQFQSIVDRIAEALGSGWARKAGRTSSRHLRVITMQADSDGPEIEVEENLHTSHGDVYMIDVTVNPAD